MSSNAPPAASNAPPAKYVVLAAIDMHEGSPLVLSRAIEVASAHPHGEVHVLSIAEPNVALVVPPSSLYAPELTGVDPVKVADFARSQLDDFQKRFPDAHLPDVEVHTAIGHPPDEIVWLAAHLDADLIMLATHGRRGIKRVLLGSVAEKVVRTAGCPVLVVRDKTHNADWRIPEIEPLCPDCAKVRAETAGKQLWCERHSERHVRANVYRYSDRNRPDIHASESSTGNV